MKYAVRVLARVQAGRVWLLLLLEMMLCLLVARSFEVLLGVSFLPRSRHVFRRDRSGKILVRLSLACLRSVIFV